MKLKLFFFVVTLFFSNHSFSLEKTTIKLGVLAFGTVNWELNALAAMELLDNANFQLEIHAVANPQAGKIALQSGAVDIIVSDWVWVSRMRSTGSDFTFYPYSTTSGALVVPANSAIKSVKDLQGKSLGIAGGELDKNWLLLQALAQQAYQLNLDKMVKKVYGAPPLLNQQIQHERVDAIMNYWHFAARLEAKGYRQIINGKEILRKLGIKKNMPALGYVFNRHWALKNKESVNDFLLYTQQAKDQICQSGEVWQQIIPLTKAKDIITQSKLRQRYCDGRVKKWGKEERLAASKIYAILRKFSQSKLTGHSEKIQVGTFWN